MAGLATASLCIYHTCFLKSWICTLMLSLVALNPSGPWKSNHLLQAYITAQLIIGSRRVREPGLVELLNKKTPCLPTPVDDDAFQADRWWSQSFEIINPQLLITLHFPNVHPYLQWSPHRNSSTSNLPPIYLCILKISEPKKEKKTQRLKLNWLVDITGVIIRPWCHEDKGYFGAPEWPNPDNYSGPSCPVLPSSKSTNTYYSIYHVYHPSYESITIHTRTRTFPLVSVSPFSPALLWSTCPRCIECQSEAKGVPNYEVSLTVL
jgi:hypothetical protein